MAALQAPPHNVRGGEDRPEYDETMKSAPQRLRMSFSRPERDTAGTARNLHSANHVPRNAGGMVTAEKLAPK